MNQSDYFENTEGTGVLGTADSKGNVDLAIYARPHIIDEQTVAFIMNERLSYKNLISNPKAAYLFLKNAPGYNGKRLYLTKVKEEQDKGLIDSMRRKSEKHREVDSNKHLVIFKVDRVRPLVGE
jgi:hypothetical protein